MIWAMALCCTLAAEAKPRTQTQIMQLAGDPDGQDGQCEICAG